MSAPVLIPVHVLTGFLGSGKTTLLNRALRAGLGAGTAVVVNEFGAIGLDQLFIQSSSDEAVVLKGGCVCCTIRTDLPATLMQLAARGGAQVPAPLRRVVIETSGLSEPVPILQTLRSDFTVRTRFRAGSVVCTVGANDDAANRERRECLAQITAADALVVTKGDIAEAAEARATEAALRALNPLAERVEGTGEAFVHWLDGREAAPEDTARWLHPQFVVPASPAHVQGVRSVVIRAAAPASWTRFAVWLTRLVFLHGDRILRTKGVLFDAERRVWIGVHGVKRCFHPPVHLTPTTPPADGSCLVFITEGLDPALIERSYRQTVSDTPGIVESR